MRPSFPFLSVIGMFGRRTSKFHPVGDNNPLLLALRGFLPGGNIRDDSRDIPARLSSRYRKDLFEGRGQFQIKRSCSAERISGGMVGLL